MTDFNTRFFDDFEDFGCRAEGTIVAAHRAYGGKVLTAFFITERSILIPVDEIDLAEVGIEIRNGVRFSAEIDPSAKTPSEVRAFGFAAIEQLQPDDTLNSVA